MLILSLDLSTSTGFALFDGDKLVDYGRHKVFIEDFNVNKDPNKSKSYPWNIIAAAGASAENAVTLILKYQPDYIVIENTVKGRNRHTQRLLEYLHLSLFQYFGKGGTLEKYKGKVSYLDPSEWRSALNARLTNDDKKNNRLVYQGKKRGKVGRKHVSVRMANDLVGDQLIKPLILKDNDIADAICQNLAFQKILQKNARL